MAAGFRAAPQRPRTSDAVHCRSVPRDSGPGISSFLLHVLAFEAAELSQQDHRARLWNGKLDDARLSQRDVERSESLFALDVQLGATIDEKLHQGVGASVRRSVKSRFVSAVHLAHVEARIDEHLQR